MKSLPRHVIAVLLVVAAAFGIALSSQSAGAQNTSPGSAPVNIVSPLPLPVNIANASPIPVSGTIAVAPNEDPVQLSTSLFFTPGEFSLFVRFYTVPEGKRLILEDISARSIMQPDATVEANLVVADTRYTRFLFFSRQHRVAATDPIDPIPVQDIFIAGGPVRVVVEAGQALEFHGRRSSSTEIATLRAYFSGHLEDVAQ